MTEIDKFNKFLVGQRLAKIWHTPQLRSDNELEGLGTPYYFRSVLELEDGNKFVFGNDWIADWDNSEALTAVTHESWHIEPDVTFSGQLITEILSNSVDEAFIRLENNSVIYHTNFYGDQLFIEAFEESLLED